MTKTAYKDHKNSEEYKREQYELDILLANNENQYRFLRHTPKDEWHIPFIEEEAHNTYPYSGLNKARLILEGLAWILVSVGVVVLASQYSI